MMTKIHFENLRCFKDFTIDNLTRLTLISGRNNVGKTTLLEGVFLLLAYRNADVFFKINGFRGAESVLDPKYLWESLFTDMDIERKLCICMTDDAGVTRALNLKKEGQLALSAPAGRDAMRPAFQPDSGGYMLRFEYMQGNQHEIGRFFFSQNALTLNSTNPDGILPKPPLGFYIGPNIQITQQSVAEWLGKIELGNKKEELAKKLRLLFEEIDDIFTVPASGMINVFSRLRTGQALPIRAMGDGINKLLHYLSAMIANPGGVFLLDEIDAGFHYSFYTKLWELVATVAQKTGSQVIATTHSYECIGAAAEGTAKVDASLLTYIRLGREDETIVPYHFSQDDLAFALKREMEVR